jgi:hypothetical protein
MSLWTYIKLYFVELKINVSTVHFFFRSAVHFGQNHFPLGLVVNPTQAKWNHSIGHWKRKQSQINSIIVHIQMPYTDTRLG